jgi:hypothetical protein
MANDRWQMTAGNAPLPFAIGHSPFTIHLLLSPRSLYHGHQVHWAWGAARTTNPEAA